MRVKINIIFLVLAVLLSFSSTATADGVINVHATSIENPGEYVQSYEVTVKNPYRVSRAEWGRIEAFALERGHDIYYSLPVGFDVFVNCPRYRSTDFMPCPPFDGEIFDNCRRSEMVKIRGLNDRDYTSAMYALYSQCLKIAFDPSIIDRLRY
jgi:hypothetical protein